MRVRRGLAGWSAGVVYAVSAAACCAVAARTTAHFDDLQVYRMGGVAVLHDGSRLYQLRLGGVLPFTYPPFAAMVFTGLAVVPWRVAVTVLTGASVVALPAALYLVLRLPGPSRMPTRGQAWTVALAVAAAAIWLEPARATLGYGQVDILLAAAVLYDLSLPDTARYKGLMIGLAAGLKLTPAIFAVYLLITGRRRAAATAAAAFAGTVAAGFAALPASSAWFWAGRFANPGHVSPVQDPQNESLAGALARAMHTAHILPVWLPLAVAVAAAERLPPRRRGARLLPVRGDRPARLADFLDPSLGHRHPGAAGGRPGGRARLPRRERRDGRPHHGCDHGSRRDRLDQTRRGHSAFGLARPAGLGAGAQRVLCPHRAGRAAGRGVEPGPFGRVGCGTGHGGSAAHGSAFPTFPP